MHRTAVFSSLHRGTALAAPMQSSGTQRLAWVGVYPLDLSDPMTREFLKNRGLEVFPSEGRAYHIRAFEVDRKLVESDVSISEAELHDPRSVIVFDDEDLVRRLEMLGAAVESLELPYKSDYPI